jgi:hypothetical protein
VYDPTAVGAQSSGHQNDLYLWPTLAFWSTDPNDSGVYAATSPAFAINHTLMTHGPTVALAPTGLAVYEITSAHPAYSTFHNSQNPNFVICPNKVDVSPAVLAAVPSAHPAESHHNMKYQFIYNKVQLFVTTYLITTLLRLQLSILFL